MEDNYDKVRYILETYKQEHILNYIDNSSEDIKNKLINQILNIDFEELRELYQKTFDSLYVDLEELQPVQGVDPDKLSDNELEMYEKIGAEIIKNNKFAVSTMAGGQGTRLRTSYA